MIEWWGDSTVGVLRGDRGRRHLRQLPGVDAAPGHRRQAWPMSEVIVVDEEGNEAAAVRVRHHLHADGRQPVRVLQGRSQDAEEPPEGQRLLDRRRCRLLRRGRAPVPQRPLERHDHRRWRQHLSRRDRGFAHPTPCGGRRRGVRHPQRGHRRGDQGGRRAARRLRRPTTPPPKRSWTTAATTSLDRSIPVRSTTRPRCPAIPTASSTSASSATPTGKAAPARSELRRGRCRRRVVR